MKTKTLMLVLFAIAMSVACKKEIAKPAKNENLKIREIKASVEDGNPDPGVGDPGTNDPGTDDTGGEDKPKPTTIP